MIVSNYLAKRFEELQRRQEAALVAFLMAGDPDLPRTLEYARAVEGGGADVLGLGVPFSDPIAESPTLEEAAHRALRHGVHLQDVLQIVRELRKSSTIPILLLSYYNPILRLGEEAFARRCSEANVDGVLIPDLPIEEATSWVNQARKYGLARIFSATPETGDERVKQICEFSSGFLYLVSRYGATGAREALAETALPLIERVRPLLPSDLKLVVGFGISTRPQIESVVRAGADGVMVTSALVARIAEGISPEALSAYVRELKEATRCPSPAPS
ncbi:MAG: tryptophan synthase subunit alpha [Candidatus Bipolaricaulota bacterium]|nr:tryptophan synthase subunit alpha [Candidatus Bipolaricaulota bacterium]MCS7275017.1 tryptophan synthase subunit alpha [Candidatus Bipolaricaulota bacterium]MDW8110327.1 tryptophan synthase subunit alpha [Candidatus Bipolaricaulota bacterium]MDW8328777.1 tryptophan synthase subunit alpha [Candidatus Bipolaricaulota bacterium]